MLTINMIKISLLQNNNQSWHGHKKIDCSHPMYRNYEYYLKNRRDTPPSKHHLQKFGMPAGKYSDIAFFNQYLKCPLQQKKRKR